MFAPNLNPARQQTLPRCVSLNQAICHLGFSMLLQQGHGNAILVECPKIRSQNLTKWVETLLLFWAALRTSVLSQVEIKQSRKPCLRRYFVGLHPGRLRPDCLKPFLQMPNLPERDLKELSLRGRREGGCHPKFPGTWPHSSSPRYDEVIRST